jgi:hypothetical protein
MSRLQYLVVDYDDTNGKCYVYVSDAANRAIIAYDVVESKGSRVVLPKVIAAGCTKRDVLYVDRHIPVGHQGVHDPDRIPTPGFCWQSDRFGRQTGQNGKLTATLSYAIIILLLLLLLKTVIGTHLQCGREGVTKDFVFPRYKIV